MERSSLPSVCRFHLNQPFFSFGREAGDIVTSTVAIFLTDPAHLPSEILLPAPPPAAPPAATGEASPDFVASPLGSVPSSGSFLKLPPNSAEYDEKWLWLWRRAAVEGALERVAPYASGVAIAFAWFVPK